MVLQSQTAGCLELVTLCPLLEQVALVVEGVDEVIKASHLDANSL